MLGSVTNGLFFFRGLIFFPHKNAHLAPESGNKCDENEGENDPDRPVFSLMTGTYRHPKRYGEGEVFLLTQGTLYSCLRSFSLFFGPVGSSPDVGSQPGSASALVLRNQDSTVAKLPDSAAGAFKCFIFST